MMRQCIIYTFRLCGADLSFDFNKDVMIMLVFVSRPINLLSEVLEEIDSA